MKRTKPAALNSEPSPLIARVVWRTQSRRSRSEKPRKAMQLASTSSWRDWCANASPFSSTRGLRRSKGSVNSSVAFVNRRAGHLSCRERRRDHWTSGLHSEKRPQAAHGGQLGCRWPAIGEARESGRRCSLLCCPGRTTTPSETRAQVFEINHQAIRLYERIGFQTEGRRRRAVVVGGDAIDVLLMARISDSKDAPGAG